MGIEDREVLQTLPDCIQVAEGKSVMYENLIEMFRIMAVTPVTSASVERGNS